uniref:Astacin domain-containing protein n=1 Tax=Strongyloides papillosus TaxID=174720 RepID=A0A0N5C3Q2_STREA
MNLSLLIVFITLLCILRNVVESQSSSKTTKLTTTKLPPYPTRPNFVNYYVSSKLGDELIRLIESELSKLSKKICLKFKKQSSKATKIGINFYYGRNNNVKLSDSENKPTTVIRNYTQYDTKTIANTSFDFYSKMLPSPYFRSNNGQKTYAFLPDLPQYYEKNINRTEFFSYNDIKRLWYLYCRDKCGKKNDCKNSAYFKNDCNHCQCPKPFAGDKCQHILKNDKSCGRTQIYFISSEREIHEKENIQSFCSYVVKGENGKKVKFEILNLKLSREDACDKGFGVEVKYRKDKGARGLFLCDNHTDISIPALSNEIYFTFSDTGKNMLEFRIQEVK